MREHLHDIDKLFQDAINNHEEMPPSSVWDGIDKNLDKTNIIDMKRKYMLLKRIAAALLLLLISAAVYMLQPGHRDKSSAANNTSPANDTLSGEKNITNLPAGKEVFHDSGNEKNTSPSNEKQDGNNLIQADSSEKLTGSPDSKSPDFKVQHTIAAASCGIKSSTGKGPGTTKIAPANKRLFDYKRQKTIDTGFAAKNYPQKINTPFRQKITITNAVIDEIDNNIAVQKNIKKNTEANKYPIEPLGGLARIAGFANEKIIAADLITPKNSPAVRNSYLPFTATDKAQQQRNFKIPKRSLFSVTAFYSPNITSFRLENDHHEREHHEDRDRIKDQEQHQTSATVGLLADYNFKKGWSLQSGFTYTTKKINIEPKKIYADLDNDGNIKYRLNCSSGYTYVTPKSGATPSVGDSVQTNKSLTSLQYIAIPFSLKYSFSVKKITVFGTVGTSVNFLTRGYMETEIADNTYTDKKANSPINGLKSTCLGGSGGMGIEYNIGKKMALTFMPSYNFAITSITQNSVVKSYPNSFSMAAGARFKL
jgi:Outer membrane protein beta-barrel domain